MKVKEKPRNINTNKREKKNLVKIMMKVAEKTEGY